MYEEDNTATKKLVGSRQARKRAEEDVKLLANRIALLKSEESKVLPNALIIVRLGRRLKTPRKKQKISCTSSNATSTPNVSKTNDSRTKPSKINNSMRR